MKSWEVVKRQSALSLRRAADDIEQLEVPISHVLLAIAAQLHQVLRELFLARVGAIVRVNTNQFNARREGRA